MKIQKNKENILITTDGAKSLVFFEGKTNIEDNIDIIINKSQESFEFSKAFIIDVPGEYEEKNVMVQAVPSASHRDIEIISLDNDGVNLIIVDSNTRIPNNKILEQVGLNNIMVFKELDGLGNFFKLIEDFSPEYLIPICKSIEVLEVIKKKLFLTTEETQKSFSITQEELPSDEEDQPIKLVILE